METIEKENQITETNSNAGRITSGGGKKSDIKETATTTATSENVDKTAKAKENKNDDDKSSGESIARVAIKTLRAENDVMDSLETTSPQTKRLKTIQKDDEPAAIDEASGITDQSTVEILSTVSVLRKFERIPIFIVDYHNEVLEFIYRCLATRHLPIENNVLIHFDSHPDMVISREIPASASFDKETMLAELSIENWIMPTCYAGHFNRVIWMKNSWCEQIPVGKYKFKVGHKDDKISVDCPLDYFISEGNYCDTSELEKARDMELLVYNADAIEEESTLKPEDILSVADANNFILDIDLDFFSTSNPFLEIYKDANCYEQLTKIFHFETALDDCGGTTERRRQQLEALKAIFEHLEHTRAFDNYPSERVAADVITEETIMKIKNLVQSLKTYYADDEIDWLLIYDSGSTTDNKGLPHHISTNADLEQYFCNFKQFLQRLPIPPVAVTIACSAEDDYCPKDQVVSIQERVLKLLYEAYGERMHTKPILYYLDEEWDVMQL